MHEPRKSWNFRRWRRRWRERSALLALRWRIWFDRHILSHERRRRWRRRWSRRTERLNRAIENLSYKVVPRRPEAAPETRWTRVGRWLDTLISKRLYPPEARLRHAQAFWPWWRHFTAPFHHINDRVRAGLDAYLIPVLTPAGFRKRFVNWRGLLGLVAGLGTLAFLAFWLLPNWARHNEQKWAAQARLLLTRGYYSLAYQNAVRVLRRDDQSEAASRVIADMLERQGLADALVWRRKVVQIDDSPTNQLALAATALRFEPAPFQTAARILENTAGATTNSTRYRAVAAEFELKSGNLTAAEGHYTVALALDPSDSEMELALAVLRLQARDAAKVAAAEQTLETLGSRTNIGVRALRPLVLLASLRGNFDAARDYSDRILANENSSFEDRLAHLGVLTRKRDPERDKFLRTLQEQVSANPIFIAQLASWMIANQEAPAALAWIANLAPPIRQAEPVRLATADAYVAQANWPGLEAFLIEQRWGTIEYVRQAMLARAYRGLGNPRAFRENLRRATDLASGMSLRLTSLTRLVSSWGWEQEAEDLIWTVAERFPNENWAADMLLRRYYERGNTDGLRRVYALQLKRSPRDLSLKNNLAMLLLLLRVDLPTAHELALEVHRQNPASAVNASTYAFSLYIQGDPLAGRKLLESLGLETLKVPSIAAYYAIVADAAGDPETARNHLEFTRQAKLLPEERAMLDRIRRKP